MLSHFQSNCSLKPELPEPPLRVRHTRSVSGQRCMTETDLDPSRCSLLAPAHPTRPEPLYLYTPPLRPSLTWTVGADGLRRQPGDLEPTRDAGRRLVLRVPLLHAALARERPIAGHLLQGGPVRGGVTEWRAADGVMAHRCVARRVRWRTLDECTRQLLSRGGHWRQAVQQRVVNEDWSTAGQRTGQTTSVPAVGLCSVLCPTWSPRMILFATHVYDFGQ